MIRVEKPHGFLIWKGKQTAIGSDVQLPVGEKVVVISGDEAYGHAVLGPAVKMLSCEFDRKEYHERHRIFPEEREHLWPGVDELFVYPIDEWERFDDQVLVRNGKLVQESAAEKRLRDQSLRLPKTIVLDDRAVCAEFPMRDIMKVEGMPDEAREEFDRAAKAAFGTEVEHGPREPGEKLALYQLSLVRLPRVRVESSDRRSEKAPGYTEGDDTCTDCLFSRDGGFCERFDFVTDEAMKCDEWRPKSVDWRGEEEKTYGELMEEMTTATPGFEDWRASSSAAGDAQADLDVGHKEGDMPYKKVERDGEWCVVVEGGKDVQCYDNESKADDLLAALNINVEEKSVDLEEQPMRVRGAFSRVYGGYEVEQRPWVMNLYDDYVIVEKGNELFKVAYEEAGGTFEFAPVNEWVPVEHDYRVKAKKQEEEETPETCPECGKEVTEGETECPSCGHDLTEGEKQPEVCRECAMEKAWDGSAARWDTAEAYCGDCLIDVSGDEKRKSHCLLPYRDPGSKEPNKDALGAIAGGRGITRVKRPEDVADDDWQAAIKSAAVKLKGWWPDAFDKEAPDSILELAKEKSAEEKAGRRIKKTMRDRLKEAVNTLKEMLDFADYEDEKKPALSQMFKDGDSGFTVKDVDGKPWMVLWSTNAFLDRDDELFSTKGLEEYVERSEQNENRGTINFWHIPDSDIVEKQWQGVAGRFLVEAGPFLDDEKGRAAAAFFKEFAGGHPDIAPEGWGASPEFRYLPEEKGNGVFETFWITRTSVLPRMDAANVWNPGLEVRDMNEKQRVAASKVFGEEWVEKLEAEAEEKTTELEREGIAHKESAEEKPAEETPAVEQETDVLAAQVALAMKEAYFEPMVAGMNRLSDEIAAVKGDVEELRGEVDEQKVVEELKSRVEMPRFQLKLVEGAKDAEETIVDESDPLLEMKPKETKKAVGDSAADSFFGPK